MEIEMGLPMEEEDPDCRPTTLLGRIRRFFDRGRGSESQWHEWWDNHRGGGLGRPSWHGGVGGGCGGGGCGGGCCGSGGCGGGGCGSC